VDAIFTPRWRKVNYSIENTRVGADDNYDKLTIELETDGTISPEEAWVEPPTSLFDSSRSLPISDLLPPGRIHVATNVPQLPPNMLDMPIEELDCRCGPTTR